MVEKMTKYSFILPSGETEGFLEWLQDLGIMDVNRSSKPVDSTSSELLEKVSGAKKTLGILEKIDYSGDPDYELICKAASETVIEGCKTCNTLMAVNRLDALKGELAAAGKALAEVQPWGSYDRDKLLGIKDLKIRWYKVPVKQYKAEWENEWAIVKVNQDKNNVWFVTLSPADAEYGFPVAECAAPALSVQQAQSRIDELNAEVIAQKGKLLALKNNYLDHVRKGLRRKTADLDRYLAAAGTEEAAEGHITIVTGFAPTSKDEELAPAFNGRDLLWISDPASVEDNPPIKIRNNWFARNFEVLTGMYGLPSYGEFDPTPILAPFFLLFFSMCMGDAGYGIILIIAGLVLKYKMGGSSLGKMHRLVTFLGVGTLIVGLFMGTFFGINLLQAEWTPSWLKAICVDGWFPEGKIAGFPAQMVMAVGIGVFHICLAMIVKTIGFTKRFGFKNTVGTWGWTLLIVGGIILAVLGTMEWLGGEALKWAVIALAVISGLAIFPFNTPGRNPLVNIGSGLWDTYNMVTGLLGDVLSYIRLYALGLAGGMLGNAFNLMGGMILNIPVPGVNWVFCIVILIFGHVLNLAMACLGAFVHPLRLTFVEYFKNSGYEGTGTAYRPLSKDIQE